MYLPDYKTIKFEHQERIDKAQRAQLASSIVRARRQERTRGQLAALKGSGSTQRRRLSLVATARAIVRRLRIASA